MMSSTKVTTVVNAGTRRLATPPMLMVGHGAMLESNQLISPEFIIASQHPD